VTPAPFAVGDDGDIGGIRWRIVQGNKGPTDLILELEGRTGFAPARMALGGLMADFFYQNEERLYPRTFGYRGGELYLDFLRVALRRGWRQAHLELEAEREKRRLRNMRAQGELVFYMDADLSVPLQEVQAFLAYFAQHPEIDVLLGNRQHAQSQITRHQTRLREGFGKTFNRVLRQALLDLPVVEHVLTDGQVRVECQGRAGGREQRKGRGEQPHGSPGCAICNCATWVGHTSDRNIGRWARGWRSACGKMCEPVGPAGEERSAICPKQGCEAGPSGRSGRL